MFPLKTTVPRRQEPLVTWGLIVINCMIFLMQAGMDEAELAALIDRFALVPARYFGDGGSGNLVPFISHSFLHGGWLHLILNMWTLWLFGPAVEDRLGSAKYLLFYLICAVLASLTFAVLDPASRVPMLGASGAIAGVLGSYTIMFPWSRVIVLVPVLFFPLFFTLPAIVFTGLWFLAQVLSGTAQLSTGSEAGGVAWWAHVGGFVAGIALTPLLRHSQRTYRDYQGDEVVLGVRPHGWR
jgi:membrane associated rhomboid family serine protease